MLPERRRYSSTGAKSAAWIRGWATLTKAWWISQRSRPSRKTRRTLSSFADPNLGHVAIDGREDVRCDDDHQFVDVLFAGVVHHCQLQPRPEAEPRNAAHGKL